MIIQYGPSSYVLAVSQGDDRVKSLRGAQSINYTDSYIAINNIGSSSGRI